MGCGAKTINTLRQLDVSMIALFRGFTSRKSATGVGSIVFLPFYRGNVPLRGRCMGVGHALLWLACQAALCSIASSLPGGQLTRAACLSWVVGIRTLALRVSMSSPLDDIAINGLLIGDRRKSASTPPPIIRCLWHRKFKERNRSERKRFVIQFHLLRAPG